MKLGVFLTGVVATLSLASAAMAQTADPAPSPAALEQARHLMQTMHIDRMMDGAMGAMKSSLTEVMSRQLPADQRQNAVILQDAIWEEMRPVIAKMMESVPALYASNFTERELAEMDRFYSSPVGQSVLEKMPRLMQDMMQKTMPVMMADMPDMMGRAFNRYCSKTACTPETRAALAKAVENMKAKPAG